jgi:SAM-dependent methyltransferase
MDIKELTAYWKEEEQKPFSGWDFSYLHGRMVLEKLPWSYELRAVELMRQSSTMLDMGTGGGELLLSLKKDWPQKVTATETYPPNYKLAGERLKPFGVKVFDVPLGDNDKMPFKDGEFDLIINRHSGFNPAEISRILAQGGVFFTQQVHGLNTYDLQLQFGAKSQFPNAIPEHYLPKLKNAGLTIINSREWSGKLSFSDVGALVYYLKAIPWVVPGFSVETHLKHLLFLQQRLENGHSLTYTLKQYFIEARK